MRFIQILLLFLMVVTFNPIEVYAQTNKSNTPVKKKVKKESFASRNYKEIQLSYGLMSDSFGLNLNGTKGDIRAQFQSLNLFYILQNPGTNTKYLYNYGFGLSFGTVKALSTDFLSSSVSAEAKGKSWFMGTFVPGVDFRNDLRTRIGLFVPISFRTFDFGFTEELKVKKDDPFSFGLGARYVNAVSLKNSFTFSVTHHVIWQATSWDLSWQRRLGL